MSDFIIKNVHRDRVNFAKIKTVFPIVAKDLFKLLIGLSVSVAIVLAIHYLV